MLRRRCAIDCIPFLKSGQPPHKTTGVDKRSWSQREIGVKVVWNKRGNSMGSIVKKKSGIEKRAPIKHLFLTIFLLHRPSAHCLKEALGPCRKEDSCRGDPGESPGA